MVAETCLLWPKRKGDDGRGDRGLGEAIRDWKRKSNGRKEGVGLPSTGRSAADGRTLLPGEDIIEPLNCGQYRAVLVLMLTRSYLNRGRTVRDGEQRANWTP